MLLAKDCCYQFLSLCHAFVLNGLPGLDSFWIIVVGLLPLPEWNISLCLTWTVYPICLLPNLFQPVWTDPPTSVLWLTIVPNVSWIYCLVFLIKLSYLQMHAYSVCDPYNTFFLIPRNSSKMFWQLTYLVQSLFFHKNVQSLVSAQPLGPGLPLQSSHHQDPDWPLTETSSSKLEVKCKHCLGKI